MVFSVGLILGQGIGMHPLEGNGLCKATHSLTKAGEKAAKNGS
jgi:hypothetical protein